MNQKEREHQFDNMKAILIFLVVLGHVLSNFGTTDAADKLYKIIFSFHMPAFIFVSGYFAKCDPKRVLARLFPLYIVFQCIRFLLDFILGSIAAGEIRPVNVQFFTPRWTLWYLFAMIIYQLLLPVFDTENRKHRLAYLLLSMALGLAVGMNPDTDNFMGMSRILNFLPFFLLGYYERSDHFLVHYGKRQHPKLAHLVSGCLAAILLVFFIMENKIIRAKWFYGTESYGGAFYWYMRLITWIVALAWIWILLVWIPERKIPLVGTIGEHTLSVYLLHSLVILILAAAGLTDLINSNLMAMIALAAILTAGLSWRGFDRMIRKIRIPYSKNRKNV